MPLVCLEETRGFFADGNSACPRLEDSVSYLWESNHLINQHLILRSWHVCLCMVKAPLRFNSHQVSLFPH